MRTEYLLLNGGPEDSAKLAHGARVLKAGGLVAFPTETVYTLAADAGNREAVAQLARLLGSLEDRPAPLFVPSLRHAEEAVGGFSRVARKLARIYWPGPLTLALPMPGGGTVSLRMPEHRVARGLLAHCRSALAVARASRVGAPEPLTALQVRDAFNGEVTLILDGGPAGRQRPATLAQVRGDEVDVQTPEGSLSAAQIVLTASPTLLFVCTGNTCRSPMAAGFCRMAVADAGHTDELPYRVLSAGTDVLPGQKVHPLAVAAMKEVHIDISHHRVTPLSLELVDTADWIFTMTRAQRESILALMPECAERLQLLAKQHGDIPEPGGYSLERYRQVRDRIHECLLEVVRLVRKSGV